MAGGALAARLERSGLLLVTPVLGLAALGKSSLPHSYNSMLHSGYMLINGRAANGHDTNLSWK